MKREFRPTTRYWITEVILPLAGFMLLIPIYLAFPDKATRICVSILFPLCIVVAVWRKVIPTWRSRLFLDEHTVSMNVEGERLGVLWRDVIAAWLEELPHGYHFLCLATKQEVFAFPLNRLDREEVWRAVQTCADPATLEKDARTKLPDYQQKLSSLQEQLDDLTLPVYARDRWLVKVAPLAFITIFLYLVVISWQSGVIIGCVILLILAALCAFLLLLSGSTEMDCEIITRNNWLGKYQIHWDEVKWIQIEFSGQVLTFCASDKRLSIPTPWADFTYSRQDKERLKILLSVQIEKRLLEIKPVRFAGPRLFKNTRIP